MRPAVEIPAWGRTLCSVQGHFFELARRKRYEMSSFVEHFMNSRIAKLLDSPYNRYQWSGEEYMLESFVDEEYAPTRLRRMDPTSPDALFWMGYTYRYWHFMKSVTSRRIYSIADFERMRRVYAGYHTLSCEEAIRRLQKKPTPTPTSTPTPTPNTYPYTFMKRAFTLVEMLIVVAILAILMSIVFRLGNVGTDERARANTVVLMNKIENCLSGYYAAFGSYPPVRVHGWRGINHELDDCGDQKDTTISSSELVWESVEAACRSQPFGCEYPPSNNENEVIQFWCEAVNERINNKKDYPKYAESPYKSIFAGGLSGPTQNGWGGDSVNNDDWRYIKLFKFGVMAYLLPRYLFMMGGDDYFYGGRGTHFAQWLGNNDLPCNPHTGEPYQTWSEVRDDVKAEQTSNGDKLSKSDYRDYMRVANIPSQAVCARWLPNLKQTCDALTDKTFFGVEVTDPDDVGVNISETYPPSPGAHYPPNGGAPYKLAFVTIEDWWGHEFYYYSPEPYQTYTLWSAGPNGKTFPPWIPLDKLESKQRSTALEWMVDDILQMRN